MAENLQEKIIELMNKHCEFSGCIKFTPWTLDHIMKDDREYCYWEADKCEFCDVMIKVVPLIKNTVKFDFIKDGPDLW
jgi:hypothetical protein